MGKKNNRGGYNPMDELSEEMDRSGNLSQQAQLGEEDFIGADVNSQSETPEASVLGEREAAVRQREEELDARTSTLESRERDLANGEQSLAASKAELEDKSKELELKEADLNERETKVKKAESDRDEGYRLAKSKHEKELQESEERSRSSIAEREQNAVGELQEKLAAIRAKHDESLAIEAKSVRDGLDSERNAWKEEYSRQKEILSKERSELDKQRGSLDAQRAELDRKTEDFDLEQLGFEQQRERFKRRMNEEKESIDDLAEERVTARKEEFETRERESREERARLLEQLASQEQLLSSFEDLKRELGGRQPQSVLTELNDLRDEIARLNDEIASGAATQQMQNRINEAESRYDSAKKTIEQLQSQRNDDAQRMLDYDKMSFDLQEANQKLEYAERIAKNCEGEVARLSQELDRYQAAYEKPKAREERITEIEKPFFVLDTKPVEEGALQAGRPKKLKKSERPDEIAWLNGIYEACEEYGLHFNQRLLKAFHTSLKTAEWSPITVLAGVSGTGKSELPRLYSHFGGLYFTSVAVQPNWDSKESMLGFFNSIDNRFDAESILRFLAQSQKDWVDSTEEGAGYPGLNDAVCMILLDEMNLAHPELYFAEFLSKFEERRGRDRDHLPAIDVKIGTGMTPHQIPLGRNMLWTGTMNQDETTKSLSDKVLDRSIVLNFPRPTELKRRTQVKSLDETNRGEILHIGTWNSWKVDEADFTEEEIIPYKTFVEEMNDSLGVVGRAIGHRVWQSVEYYMASYPEVRLGEKGSKERARAMHVAFEDQIVQKIMPKLRGIDTTGESEKKCLIPIKNLLLKGVNDNPFNLGDDFDLACRLGYGQFVWQSANYLKEEGAE